MLRPIHALNVPSLMQVIYGDTDSLFVHLPGRSRAEAHAIGEEIARQVTERHPAPVKLKMEKVYLPCVLQVRQRTNSHERHPVPFTKPLTSVLGDSNSHSAERVEAALGACPAHVSGDAR